MVRNFWIEADIDGYKTDLKGGPRSKKDGLTATLYQRDDGEIKTAVKIYCCADGEKLKTEVEVDGKTVAVYETRR